VRGGGAPAPTTTASELGFAGLNGFLHVAGNPAAGWSYSASLRFSAPLPAASTTMTPRAIA
jgi:hypothetical protein